MTEKMDRSQDRIIRRQVDKFGRRREQLAAAALVTLSELGYARTSLREIAQNSDFSHGILHYYFRDKIELITFCVRRYREDQISRYEHLLHTASTADDLRRAFGEAIAGTWQEDEPGYRLWYDLRNQSLFDDSLRHEVLETDECLHQAIWRVISQYGQLAGKVAVLPSVATYALFDGLIHQGLLRTAAGIDTAAIDLRSYVELLLDYVVR